MELLILPNGIFKKIFLVKIFVICTQIRRDNFKREFHKCFALRFLSERSKKKRKIFHSQIYSGEFFLHLLDAHTILSVKKYPSV